MKKYDGLYIFAGNAKDDVLESNFPMLCLAHWFKLTFVLLQP